MPKITESAIEDLCIARLQAHGFNYIYGPDIAPDGATPRRASFADVLLLDDLQAAIERINPDISAAARAEALKQIQDVYSPQLISANESFHRMLTEGVNVTFQRDGITRGDYVWAVDFEHPEVVNPLIITFLK